MRELPLARPPRLFRRPSRIRKARRRVKGLPPPPPARFARHLVRFAGEDPSRGTDPQRGRGPCEAWWRGHATGKAEACAEARKILCLDLDAFSVRSHLRRCRNGPLFGQGCRLWGFAADSLQNQQTAATAPRRARPLPNSLLDRGNFPVLRELQKWTKAE